jgi:hypothetical protein
LIFNPRSYVDRVGLTSPSHSWVMPSSFRITYARPNRNSK